MTALSSDLNSFLWITIMIWPNISLTLKNNKSHLKIKRRMLYKKINSSNRMNISLSNKWIGKTLIQVPLIFLPNATFQIIKAYMVAQPQQIPLLKSILVILDLTLQIQLRLLIMFCLRMRFISQSLMPIHLLNLLWLHQITKIGCSNKTKSLFKMHHSHSFLKN